jgi:flavin-dependent dehydrogenase
VGEVLPPRTFFELADLGMAAVTQQPDLSIPYSGITAWWGGPLEQAVDYLSNPIGRGWCIDRAALAGAFRLHAERSGVVVAAVNKNLVRAKAVVDGWEIQSGSPGGLRCRILVVANGRAGLGAVVGGGRGGKRYVDNLIASYRYYSATAVDLEPRLYVEARPHGWCYAALLPGARILRAYLGDGDQRANWQSGASRGVGLEGEIAARLSRATPVSAEAVCNASSGFVRLESEQNVLCVGDALMTTDPLRGSGIVTALEQAKDAAHSIAEHLAGSGEALVGYLRRWQQKFAEHEDNRIGQYARETRWLQNEFWRRRQSAVSAAS